MKAGQIVRLTPRVRKNLLENRQIKKNDRLFRIVQIHIVGYGVHSTLYSQPGIFVHIHKRHDPAEGILSTKTSKTMKARRNKDNEYEYYWRTVKPKPETATKSERVFMLQSLASERQIRLKAYHIRTITQ